MERRSSGTYWNFFPLSSSRALGERENVKRIGRGGTGGEEKREGELSAQQLWLSICLFFQSLDTVFEPVDR